MRRVAALAVCGLLLTGCSSGTLSGQDKLQNDTANLVDAVNAKQTVQVQQDVDTLKADIEALVADNKMDSNRAAGLKALLSQIRLNADDLGKPSPTPTLSATPSPTASPSASPTPSPTPVVTTPPPTTAPPTTAPPTTAPPTSLPTLGAGLTTTAP